jgi:hypothetical protein
VKAEDTGRTTRAARNRAGSDDGSQRDADTGVSSDPAVASLTDAESDMTSDSDADADDAFGGTGDTVAVGQTVGEAGGGFHHTGSAASSASEPVEPSHDAASVESNDAETPDPDESFVVFDALLHRGKPDLSQHGLIRLAGVYETRIWPNGADRSLMPRESWMRHLARWYAQRRSIVFLNIEHWPPDTFYRNANEAKVIETHKRLATIVRWMKSEAPSLRVGYYSLLPLAEYSGPVRGIEWRIRRAQKENQRFRETGLADAVDYIAPSLYVRYSDDPEKWKKWAKFRIDEAKKFGKPVYPFLWYLYHDAAPEHLRGREIPRDFFRMQLDFCREHADGVILWGGYRKQWDQDAAWWKAVKEMIAEKSE